MTPDRETIMDFVLGNLSPEEAAQMQQALERDPALYAEWQADQEALTLLVDDLDLNDVNVPADAGYRLLDRLHAEESRSAPVPPTPLPGLPAAPASGLGTWGLILLAVAAVSLVTLWTRPAPDALSRYARVPGAVSRTVQVTGQAPARLVQLPDGRVFIRMDQAAQAGQTYQLWAVRGAAPVSLGIFSQEYLSAAWPGTGQLAVSVEPPGGSPQPTTTPLFLQGL